MNPWMFVGPKSSVEFKCKHCGQVQPQEYGRLIICQCEGSLKEQSEERQRQDNWRRDQQLARQIKR